MKILSRQLFLGAALAGLFCLTFVAQAQEPPATAEKSSPPPVAPNPAASTSDAPKAGVTPAPPTLDAPATVEPQKEPGAEPALRRIDEPNDGKRSRGFRRSRGGSSADFPLGDHTIPQGGRATEVISILGSSTVEGEIDSDAVSIRGDTTVGRDGKVGGGAVAVLGHVNVKGEVHDEVVSVLGGVSIDGHVGNDVVAVLGDLELGPNAVVDGDLVLVGGSLTKDPKAVVHGNEVHVAQFGNLNGLDGLAAWIGHCLLLGRPLAFGEHLGWAWGVAMAFLALYVVFALLFRSGIEKCALTLETRPGRSVLAAVFTMLLAPVAIVLLCVTVIGIPLVPFLAAALFFSTLFGKAVMLAWIGRRFTKFFGDGPLAHPAVAVLIGGFVVLAFYLLPFVGFLTYKLLGWLGLGVVVYTVVLGSKREKAVVPRVARTAPVVTPPAAAMSSVAGVAAPAAAFASAAAGMETTDPASPTPTPAPEPTPTPAPAPAAAMVAPPLVAAATLPRAGFWIRMAALALDLILIGAIVGFSTSLLPHSFQRHLPAPPGVLPLVAIYGALMWKMKGTTIGGIVCGLKVVRVDGREIDWPTAIVRALACFLSLVVAGLGFIWVVIDEDKQSWHDKIAGTAVVCVPKGMSLL